jgi:hypothetical protein
VYSIEYHLSPTNSLQTMHHAEPIGDVAMADKKSTEGMAPKSYIDCEGAQVKWKGMVLTTTMTMDPRTMPLSREALCTLMDYKRRPSDVDRVSYGREKASCTGPGRLV